MQNVAIVDLVMLSLAQNAVPKGAGKGIFPRLPRPVGTLSDWGNRVMLRFGAYRKLFNRSKNFVACVAGSGPDVAAADDAASSPIKDLKWRPAPLINWTERFGVLWSGKVGSMAVTYWFLARLGLLDAARQYGRNPHNYRIDVLLKDPTYQADVVSCDPAALRWLRIIRSPYKRAVSSYHHVVRHRFDDAEIEKHLGISIPESGLSFQEFLDYLLAIDVVTCNVHYRQQWHPLEARVVPRRDVNIDEQNLLAALDAFESDLGLPPLAPATRATLLAELKRESTRHHKPLDMNDSVAEMRFRRSDSKGNWPGYEMFLTETARDKIDRIYAKDFAAYGDFL